jgi:hypothetical protein
MMPAIVTVFIWFWIWALGIMLSLLIVTVPIRLLIKGLAYWFTGGARLTKRL